MKKFQKITWGFTMAEILLSLTIIGVVAAITLPSLTGNINERTWNTQRKALYSRISQAISLMPALNGYGTLNDTTDNAAETFVTAGLSKVLKINNICNENFSDCGIVSTYANIRGTKSTVPQNLYALNNTFSLVSANGNSYTTSNTNAVAFETQNGESIVAYYNRACRTQYLNETQPNGFGNIYGFPQANMCVNFLYDLNGTKGPNTIGKDMGVITVFNATDSIIVSPMPNNTNATIGYTNVNWFRAQEICKEQDEESRLPNIHELVSIMFNKDFFDFSNATGFYWSSTLYDSTQALGVFPSGRQSTNYKNNLYSVRCIKR